MKLEAELHVACCVWCETRSVTQSKSSDADTTLALEHEDESVLIERVSSARMSGTDDQAAADELLRRAAAENRSALDRLGR